MPVCNGQFQLRYSRAFIWGGDFLLAEKSGQSRLQDLLFFSIIKELGERRKHNDITDQALLTSQFQRISVIELVINRPFTEPNPTAYIFGQSHHSIARGSDSRNAAVQQIRTSCLARLSTFLRADSEAASQPDFIVLEVNVAI